MPAVASAAASLRRGLVRVYRRRAAKQLAREYGASKLHVTALLLTLEESDVGVRDGHLAELLAERAGLPPPPAGQEVRSGSARSSPPSQQDRP